MEQFEKSPTPREQLDATAKELRALADEADATAFYLTLAHRLGESDETWESVSENLAQHDAWANDIYTDRVFMEEESEVDEVDDEGVTVNYLELLRKQFRRLANETQAALISNDFTALQGVVRELGQAVHDDVLFSVQDLEESEAHAEAVEKLTPWLMEYLNRIDSTLAQVSAAPEFHLDGDA